MSTLSEPGAPGAPGASGASDDLVEHGLGAGPASATDETLRRTHEFPVLDSLRAVGALAVLTTHAAYWANAYTTYGVFGTVLARLDVGVAIFFVLSGFLLARPYLARAGAGRPAPGTGRYLFKRFLRIFPLYLITVVLALGLVHQHRAPGVGGWIRTLTMTNTFLDPDLPDGLTQMWSLAVEFTFYLLLPLLMFTALGRRRPFNPARVLAVLAALVVVSGWWHLTGTGSAQRVLGGQPGQWLPGYLSWFALGIFLALVHELHERGRWSRLTRPLVAMARQPGCLWALVVGLMLFAATPLTGPSMLAAATPAQSQTKSLCYALVGGLVVLSGVFADPGRAYARVLSAPVVRHLGFISYGIFCLHLPMLHLIMRVTGWTLFGGHLIGIWTLCVVLSLVAAEASYRLVEGPLMSLKNLGRREPAEPIAATSGTSIT